MAAEIYIVSGFLGAGKTTFIQKLLSEAFINDKTVLIENDFGESSVDAALLKAGGIEVKELNTGCICCSLSGDFVKALKEINERYHPAKIVIEPSGVGKLSDILKVCSDKRLGGLASVAAKITVADVGRCKMYLDNFGEFFEDQIEHADAVVLSRIETNPERTAAARSLIRQLNPGAAIISDPWNCFKAGALLEALKKPHGNLEVSQTHDHAEHCHDAEEAFETVTVYTDRKFSPAQLETCIRRMTRMPGAVLRAKGIVRGSDGYLEVQFVPDDLKISECTAAGNMLCFIGEGLSRDALTAVFDGK